MVNENLPTHLSTHDCVCGHKQNKHGNVAPYVCITGLWSSGIAFEGDYLGSCPCAGYLGANAQAWEEERSFKHANAHLKRELDGDLLGYETAGDRDFWLSLTAAGYDFKTKD